MACIIIPASHNYPSINNNRHHSTPPFQKVLHSQKCGEKEIPMDLILPARVLLCTKYIIRAMKTKIKINFIFVHVHPTRLHSECCCINSIFEFFFIRSTRHDVSRVKLRRCRWMSLIFAGMQIYLYATMALFS